MKRDDLFQYRDVQRIPKPWGYELIFAIGISQNKAL